MCDTESLIRLYQTQDMLLFLIAKEFLPQELITGDTCQLKNIKGLLNTPATFSVAAGKGSVTIKAESVKIRDYGKVFAIQYNNRFNSLADILNKKLGGRTKINITYQQYKEESENYESCRLKIVPLLHSFEKLMVEKFPGLEKEPEEEYYNFTALIKTFKTKTDAINDDNVKFIQETRNMFMHDEYKKECIDNVRNNKLGYAEEKERKFSDKMNEMIRVLKGI